MKGYRKFLCICGLIIWCVPRNSPAEQMQGSITARADSTGAVRGRFLFSGPAWKGSFLSVFTADGKEKFAGGFSVPRLICGTVECRGLFNEIDHPASHSAGSEAFFRNTELSLSSSLNPGKRYGALFSVIPGTLSVYAMIHKKTWSCGGVFRYTAGKIFGVQGILQYSSYDPQYDPSGAAWFSDYPEFLDTCMLHGAVKIHFHSGGFSAGYAVFTSASPSNPLGFSQRLAVRVRTKPLDIDIICNADGNYFTPSGIFPKEALVLSFAGTLFPSNGFSVTLKGTRKVFRLPFFPVANRKDTDNLSVTCSYDNQVLSCSGEFDYRCVISSFDELFCSDQFRLQAGITGLRTGIGLACSYSIDSGGEHILKGYAEWSFYSQIAEVKIKPAFSLGSITDYSAAVRVDFKNRDGEPAGFLKADIQAESPFRTWLKEFQKTPFRYLDFELGWKSSFKG